MQTAQKKGGVGALLLCAISLLNNSHTIPYSGIYVKT